MFTAPAEGLKNLDFNPVLNGAKTRRIWGDLLPRRGYKILAQGFNPGNRPPGDAP
jgi:hypothetical protein